MRFCTSGYDICYVPVGTGIDPLEVWIMIRYIGGQLDDGAELHVLAQASTYVRRVLHDGGRVGVGDGGWGTDERQADALSDVGLDVGQLAQVGSRLSPHASDGGQPVALLLRTVDMGRCGCAAAGVEVGENARAEVGPEVGAEVGEQRYGRRHSLVHVSWC